MKARSVANIEIGGQSLMMDPTEDDTLSKKKDEDDGRILPTIKIKNRDVFISKDAASASKLSA